MFNKSYITIWLGLISMMVASAIFYFEVRSIFSYALFGIGFILVGIGLLLGFFNMVSDKK